MNPSWLTLAFALNLLQVAVENPHHPFYATASGALGGTLLVALPALVWKWSRRQPQVRHEWTFCFAFLATVIWFYGLAKDGRLPL